MGEQLSFAGVEASRQPADGLFFAIFPDEFTAVDTSPLARRQRRA